MANCCFPPGSANSWIEWQHSNPVEILDLVANASIASTVGTFANSSNYGSPASWASNSFTITTAPTCAALGFDSGDKVANAAQWNFQHQTANLLTTNAIPLRKILYLRAGTQWEMSIPISLGGSTYTDIQLSFLNNAGTRGDAQGTVPVIQWTGSFTGDVVLKVVLKVPGRFTIGLRAATGGGSTSMFDMGWVVISDPTRRSITIEEAIAESGGHQQGSSPTGGVVMRPPRTITIEEAIAESGGHQQGSTPVGGAMFRPRTITIEEAIAESGGHQQGSTPVGGAIISPFIY
jgi:hypothetical protein